MYRVIIVNPGEDSGFQPDRVIPVHWINDLKGLPALFAKRGQGAVAIIVNEDAEEFHPPSPGGVRKIMLGTVAKLVTFGLRILQSKQSTDEKVRNAAAVEASRREYDERIAREVAAKKKDT